VPIRLVCIAISIASPIVLAVRVLVVCILGANVRDVVSMVLRFVVVILDLRVTPVSRILGLRAFILLLDRHV